MKTHTMLYDTKKKGKKITQKQASHNKGLTLQGAVHSVTDTATHVSNPIDLAHKINCQIRARTLSPSESRLMSPIFKFVK